MTSKPSPEASPTKSPFPTYGMRYGQVASDQTQQAPQASGTKCPLPQHLQEDQLQGTKQSRGVSNNNRHRNVGHRKVHDLADGNPGLALVKTTERQIVVDGGVFMNLFMGDLTSCQLVYVTSQVTCLFLS